MYTQKTKYESIETWFLMTSSIYSVVALRLSSLSLHPHAISPPLLRTTLQKQKHVFQIEIIRILWMREKAVNSDRLRLFLLINKII